MQCAWNFDSTGRTLTFGYSVSGLFDVWIPSFDWFSS